MLESLFILLATTPSQSSATEAIPVESAVVSVIDDVNLAFGESGIVQFVRFEAGNEVKKGDLLAELNSVDAELEISRVEAELVMARLKAENDLSLRLTEKALGVAEAELKRAIKSNEQFAETVSESEIDRLRLTRDEADLRIQQARHDLEYAHLEVRLKEAELAIARRKRERRQLYAPVDGIIVKAEKQAGEWTQPDQLFCRIIRTDRVRVEGLVNEIDGEVTVGQLAELSIVSRKSGKRLEFIGEVVFVDPEIDSVTGQYRVSAEFENRDGTLRPGQRPTLVISKSH